MSAAPMARFEDALREGRLELPSCDACDAQVFPPQTVCPACGSPSLTWRTADPHGVVVSTTTLRRRPERGGDLDVSLVRLNGGAVLMSRVTGDPSAVLIDEPVRARVVTDEPPLVVFDPTGRTR